MSVQAPTLDSRRKRTPTRFTHVTRFLDYLGVPYNKARGVSRGRREGFWQRNDGQLEWIYKDAKRAYAEAAKKAHPDYGGSHEAMAALNEGWELLNRQFALHCRSMARLRVTEDIPIRQHYEKRGNPTMIAGTEKARHAASKARKYRWDGHIYVDERLRRQNRYAALSSKAREQALEKKRLYNKRRREEFNLANCCRECGCPIGVNGCGNYCDKCREKKRNLARKYRTKIDQNNAIIA